MKFERGIGVTTKELSKYFITLEGNDGSGKGSQINSIVNFLKKELEKLI